MINIILFSLGAGFILFFGAMLCNNFFRRPGRPSENQPLSMEYYLFKIARVTGKSEYDVFCKSAEDWPISQARIEQDFKRYLVHQSVPHYVNDFVRKNKKHIDELSIPRF